MEAFLNAHEAEFHWREFDSLGRHEALLPSELDTAYDHQCKAGTDELQDDVMQLAAAAEAQRQDDIVQLMAAAEPSWTDTMQLRTESMDARETELELISNYRPTSFIDAGTPAEKILTIVSDLLAGVKPSVPDLVCVQRCIMDSQDIYKLFGLNKKILDADAIDEDVRHSLIRQLGDSTIGESDVATPQHDGVKVSAMRVRDFLLPAKSVTAEAELPEDFGTLEGALTALMNPPGLSSRTSGGPVAHIVVVPDSPLNVPRSLSVEAEKLLRTAGDWQFDVFHMASATNNHSLSCLAFFLFSENNLISEFKLDAGKLACFLRSVEGGYQENPYHNAVHATDVLHTMHVLLHKGGMVSAYADYLTIMAAYFAALVHDFEHGGLTNDYLIITGDGLALMYNDKAPLENHHLAAAFALLQQPKCNFLAGLKRQEAVRFRKLVIEMVLATDMKQHFNMMSYFNTVHRITGNPGPNDIKQRAGDEERMPTPLDENERMLSLQMALKCADLGHTAADLKTHMRWVAALEEEFFKQGDRERTQGLSISPLFDRFKQGISKSQVGFFDIVVIPVFTSFTSIFTAARPLLSSVINNYNHWVEQQLIGALDGAGVRIPAQASSASNFPTIRATRSVDAEAPSDARAQRPPLSPDQTGLPSLQLDVLERADMALSQTLPRLTRASKSDGSVQMAEVLKNDITFGRAGPA